MARFDIRADKTALLIIDMQNAFLKPGSPLERATGRDLVPRLNQLMRACRQVKIPVIFTCQVFLADGSDLGLMTEFVPELYRTKPTLVAGTPDVELYAEMEVQQSDIIINKRIYSAFQGTELDLLLRIRGIDTLIIGGVDTLMCCEATARSARHRNYRVIFLSDGTATGDQPDAGWGAFSEDETQRFVLTLMARRYAEVSSVAEIVRRVQRLAAPKK